MAQTAPLKKLVQAPFQLHDHLLQLISNEVSSAKNGRGGHIIAKLNALTEPEIIAALYEASSAGVVVDLIVRGTCCLRPGISGTSENIRVRSIIGRFLEHSRVYYFQADGEEKVFCASADWMDRNLFRRVEACFPISDNQLKKRIISDLDLGLQDNAGAWELQSDGLWTKVQKLPGEDDISNQQALLQKLAEWG